MWEFATKFFPFFSFCLSPLHPSLPPPTPTSGNHHSVPCVYKLNFLCVCFVFKIPYKITGLPRCTSGKEPNCRCRRLRDMGSIPGSGRSPRGGQGNSLQCSCLENPMDREAWQAIVHRFAKSWTPLQQLSMHTCMHS